MRQDIRLFIGNREVEFNAAPQVLYNYTETDLRNPTTVKNSFTKSISIEGTKSNNDLFGHFWDLERYQDYGGNIGAGFNPLKKTSFLLFVNGGLYEKGYCKLNSVEVDSSGNRKFNITLFGGLGNFLTMLSYQPDSDTDAKLSLADLDYDFAEDGLEGMMQEWRINKDEVWNAWGRICNYGETTNIRHEFIQYVPTYGGAPEGFDSEKVLINCNDFPSIVHTNGYNIDGTNYRPVLNGIPTPYGFALGEYDGDLTPWTTFDLRSYLMQPAVRMMHIIKACGNPAINGGYELDLDPHFFNDDNPYFYDSFVTLPSFRDMGIGEAESETITGGASLQMSTGGRPDLYAVTYNGQTLSKISNTKLTMKVGFTPSDSTTASILYTDTHYEGNAGFNRRQSYISAGGCIIQLWAVDGSGNIVGTSNAYLLSSTRTKANNSDPLWWNYYNKNELDTPTAFTWIDGVWTKINGQYVFAQRGSNAPVELEFKLNASVAYDHLIMKIKWPYTYFTSRKRSGKNAPVTYYYPEDDSEDNYYEVNPTGFPMYTTETSTGSTWDMDFSDIITYNRVRGAFNYDITSFELSSENYSEFISNAKLDKRKVLGGTATPAEYLLSFAKMFGLYFYYDPSEAATDPVAAPNGVIHLMDRDTFYTDEVEDINDLIDHSRQSTITPTVASSKWLSFNLEQIESEVNKDYMAKWGYDYGRQLVNTSYNYDANTTNIYDGNVFKGGIMTRENNPLYRTCNYEDTSVSPMLEGTLPYYAFTGKLKYKLYYRAGNELEDYEFDINIGANSYFSYYTPMSINNLGLKGFDALPKLQCHTDNNSPSDGSGVLLFLNGPIHCDTELGVVDYYITDDLPDMAGLNDSTPCFILTQSEFDAADNRIARKVNSLPNFTRDWINGGQQEGYIVSSWNFGHPQETFVPNVYSTDGDSIYDKFWKNYIGDLYDVNTKTFKTFVNFKERPNGSMLRRYFWFANGIWRLNAIQDLDINSYQTTQCEFVKIQDMDNYKLDSASAGGTRYITLDTYNIEYSGGTIGGTVYLQDGGTWYRGDALKIAYSNGESHMEDQDTWLSPATGSGQSSRFTVTIPENTSAYTRYITIYIEYEDYPPMTATITQKTEDTPVINIVRNVTLVAEGETKTINFTYSNILPETLAMTTTYGPLTTPWLTATFNSGGTIVLSAGTNNTGSERGAVLTLTATATRGGTATAICNVTQDGGELYVNPLTLVFDYDSTTGKTLTITTNGDWSATINDTQ